MGIKSSARAALLVAGFLALALVLTACGTPAAPSGGSAKKQSAAATQTPTPTAEKKDADDVGDGPDVGKSGTKAKSGSGPNQAAPPSAVEVAEDKLGDRVLVIAPHPDDETIGPAILVRDLLKEGKDVSVLMITSGDGYIGGAQSWLGANGDIHAKLQQYGTIRAKETETALAKLGVNRDHIYYMGFPDGGSSSVWDSEWDDDNPHKGRNGATTVPYDFAMQKGAPYSGAEYVRQLEGVLKKVKPTGIVFPDPYDYHQEHWGAGAFLQYALMDMSQNPAQVTYLVHRHDFPLPTGYLPGQYLYPPKVLWQLDAKWLSLPVSTADAALKKDALSAYATQYKAGATFMDAFARSNEVFGAYRRPVLTVEKTEPDMGAGKLMPGAKISDAPGDTVQGGSPNGGDIDYMAVAAGPKYLDFGMSLSTPPNNAYDYLYHLRIKTAKGIKRYDVKVESLDHADWMTLSKESQTLDTPILFQTSGNRLWIQLPANVLAGSPELLAATEVWNGPTMVDKTAYRRIVVKNAPPASAAPKATTGRWQTDGSANIDPNSTHGAH